MKTTLAPFDQRFIEVPMKDIHMHRPMPRLLICQALAADPKRHAFASWLNDLLTSTNHNNSHHVMARLTGMLFAYHEMGVITLEQQRGMYDELLAYVDGAAV
jgi:hypothetical protein